MDELDRARRTQTGTEGSPGSPTDRAPADRAAGTRTRVASRYPALAQALDRQGGAAPTIHDAATAAVKGKDAGAVVDPGVASRVGAQLGVDFSAVRVHGDPLARESTHAMGARAFAYGADVFLGPGESGTDLGLMAHELTHVAQQGAAGQRAPQRAVQVGDVNSPAEHEADRVAADVTGGTGRPASLIVDDGPVAPGQMLKSTFVEQLRTQVTAAAAEELGPLSVVGCPYIEQYFSRYGGQPAAAGEAMLRRYTPATRTVTDAAAMIPLVVARVREGARSWRETGAPPADLAAADPAAAAAPPGEAAEAPTAAPSLVEPDSPADLTQRLGAGEALDGATAARMQEGFGESFASVRIHTDATAARMADAHDAHAFTIGNHVAFAGGAYQPGTLAGDALLAHELAHVGQQRGATLDAEPARRKPSSSGSAAGGRPDKASDGGGDAFEQAADDVALGALGRVYGASASFTDELLARGRTAPSGLALQRCSRPRAPAPPAIPTTHGADLHAGAHVPTAAQQTDILHHLDPSTRPRPVTPAPAPTGSTPAPTGSTPAPTGSTPAPVDNTWDGLSTRADSAAKRAELQRDMLAAMRLYLDGQAASIAARMALPRMNMTANSTRTTGVQEIGERARTAITDRYGGSIDAGATTPTHTAARGPVVSGTNIFDGNDPVQRRAAVGETADMFARRQAAWLLLSTPETQPVRDAHNFVPGRGGEEAAFYEALLTAFLSTPANVTDISNFRIYGTAEQTTTGIMMATAYDPASQGGDAVRAERAERWNVFGYCVHELMHARCHPAFRAAIQLRGVMNEGFNELFASETTTPLRAAAAAGTAEPLRALVEGGVYPLDAGLVGTYTIPGTYAPLVTEAQEVRRVVGEDAMRAAYFEGHVELLGLTTTGDQLPATDLATGGATPDPLPRPPGVSDLAGLARASGVARATIVADNPGITDALQPRIVLRGCRLHRVVEAVTGTERQAEGRTQIAAQNGVSEADLVRANPGIAVDPATNAWPALTAGQQILIPVHSP